MSKRWTVTVRFGDDPPIVLAVWERKLSDAEIQHIVARFIACDCALCFEGRIAAENQREAERCPKNN